MFFLEFLKKESGLMLYWLNWNRKVNSSPRMDSQKHHFQMGGKEMLDYTQLGSQGEGCLVHLQMP